MKKYLRKKVRKFIDDHTNLNHATYSQVGEDRIIHFLFKDKGIDKITYLDIGTNSPNQSNNTYLFYRWGNTGVCVEADGTWIENIRKIRPNDTVLHAGVSFTENTTGDFYIFDEPAVSTFDKDEADKRIQAGVRKLVRVDKMPLITVASIINQCFQKVPNLLSIDIEGIDLEVLKSIDYKENPFQVICVETCEYSETHIRPKNNLIKEFMQSVGYEVYADTYVNTIFVNKKWFYNPR